MGHRPMYCSNADEDDCTRFDDRVRKGFPFIHTYGLEELFYKYGVDGIKFLLLILTFR
jgi:acid phosphatase type 7